MIKIDITNTLYINVTVYEYIMDTLNKARTIYKLIEILNDIRDNDYCDHKKNNFLKNI